MAGTRQNILASKANITKHFNVKSNGILTVKAGYVYYENSSSDYQQIVMTDEDGNLQPVLLSTTKDFTEITMSTPPRGVGRSDILGI
jgi:hypothetical protein